MSFSVCKFISFLLCFVNILYGQSNDEKQLSLAIDSLNSNSNYAYKTLSQVLKQDNTPVFNAKAELFLGNYFNTINIVDSSMYYTKRALLHLKDEELIARAYHIMGFCYKKKGKVDNAMEMLFKSLKISKKNDYREITCDVKLDLGILYAIKKNYSRAIEYYDKSKTIAEANGFKDKSINAQVHKAMSISKLGKPNQAITMLLNNLESAKKISSLTIQKNIYNNLVEIYSTTKNYKSANTALVNFYKLRDSITNAKHKNEITALVANYETVNEKKDILTLNEALTDNNSEIKRERLHKKIFLYGFLIILIPTLGLLFVYAQKLKVKNKYNQQKEAINKQKITTLLKEHELTLANTYMLAQNQVRSRIGRELHDSIGGNLAGIKLQMEGRVHELPLLKEFIPRINYTYEQVRAISHNLVQKKFNNTQFSKYLSDYIDTISKATETDILFITHQVEKINTIDENKKSEIFKIIQELINNTLKHAKAKEIEICLNAYQDKIEIFFEDDGVGFNTQKRVSGIGLQNIKERLSLLNASIDIDSVINRGTAVRIEIPLK
ncbi:tetratricopeptide repeat-containing sensor histidine kinase [uncultured Lacinutrix sp.]|uniref:tetratricopeptide repeat-containing sensor histidine kinase n=1 Tax=uncultured Lacinutrix sp. TaxID=574032 RepID=UPI0026056F60|nr:tetratricopeptide repeat-containing sensor histidine kinase [uncultured Lacinutrix sp.]